MNDIGYCSFLGYGRWHNKISHGETVSYFMECIVFFTGVYWFDKVMTPRELYPFCLSLIHGA